MAPAYCANMAAPLSRLWHGWNRPIQETWFGTHKTVIGFLLGVVAAVLATFAQWLIGASFSLLDYRQWFVLGLAFGFGAMAGDTAKSFVKRKLRYPTGARWLHFDQLDIAAVALLLVATFASLTVIDVLWILALTLFGHLAVNQIAFRFGITKTTLGSSSQVAMAT